MDSDYEKQLEDENQKLREQLIREQEESDMYKDYFDLLENSELVEFRRQGEDDGWFTTANPTKEFAHIVITTKDFHSFPMLHEKIDEYHRERRRLIAIHDENEIKWEKRKKIIFISLIVAGSGLALWGLGWCIWWAYFVTI